MISVSKSSIKEELFNIIGEPSHLYLTRAFIEAHISFKYVRMKDMN